MLPDVPCQFDGKDKGDGRGQASQPRTDIKINAPDQNR